MAIREAFGGFAVMALLAGCGGGSEMGGGASYATATNAPAVDSSYKGAGEPSATAPMTDSRSGGAMHQEALNQAPERPGLGTEWGETRASHVHEVSFDRDGSTPFATVRSTTTTRRASRRCRVHRGVRRMLPDVPGRAARSPVSIAASTASRSTPSVGDRTYVVGREGERYSIVLSNQTNRRFEAVATVDGLDVINGQPAALATAATSSSPTRRSRSTASARATTVAAFRFWRVATRTPRRRAATQRRRHRRRVLRRARRLVHAVDLRRAPHARHREPVPRRPPLRPAPPGH